MRLKEAHLVAARRAEHGTCLQDTGQGLQGKEMETETQKDGKKARQLWGFGYEEKGWCWRE